MCWHENRTEGEGFYVIKHQETGFLLVAVIAKVLFLHDLRFLCSAEEHNTSTREPGSNDHQKLIKFPGEILPQI